MNEIEAVMVASHRWADARGRERIAAQELREAIREAREAGHSLAQVAQVLGVSRQRVMQLSR